MKNRFLSVLLTLCMVLAMFPGTALAVSVNDQTHVATDGDTVYAVGNDVTLATLVDAVPAKGTVLVNATYNVAADTEATQAVTIAKEFTLQLDVDCSSNLKVEEGAVLTVAGNGKLTGSLTMTAGTYKGILPAGTKTITGGTFDSDVSEHLTSEYKCVDNGDGTYTVVKPVVVTPEESANTDGTVNNTGSVTTEQITSAEVKEGTLTIQATTETNKEVAKVEITLPTAAVKEKTEATSVQIETNVGTVELPTEALTAVSEDVKMVVEKEKEPAPATTADGKEVKPAVSFHVDLKKASNDEKVTVAGLSAPIKLSFNIKGMTGLPANPVLAFIDRVKNAVTALENRGYDAETGNIFGYVNHLSEFGVVGQADLPTEPDEPGTDDPKPENKPVITFSNEAKGGVGNVRDIMISGEIDGMYLVVRIQNATGRNTILMVPAAAKMPISYADSGAAILAILVKPEDAATIPTITADFLQKTAVAYLNG